MADSVTIEDRLRLLGRPALPLPSCFDRYLELYTQQLKRMKDFDLTHLGAAEDAALALKLKLKEGRG